MKLYPKSDDLHDDCQLEIVENRGNKILVRLTSIDRTRLTTPFILRDVQTRIQELGYTITASDPFTAIYPVDAEGNPITSLGVKPHLYRCEIIFYTT